MATKYEWTFKVDNLENVGEFEGVIKEVHWRLTGTDGNLSGSVYGSVNLDDPESKSKFKSVDKLSKKDLKEWTLNKLEESETVMKAKVQERINSQKKPKVNLEF